MATDGTDLVSLLPASNVVGTTRVRHPTIYVFTGGNEDAAFLSIYGFNLLLDGGDQKEIAYWNFIKNYDKINLVLSTRPSPNCVRGISTILARKAIEQCHPKIGAFIGNLPSRANCTGDNDAAKSILSVYEGLQAEGIKPYDAYVNPKMEPLTLYEVIGEGSLKMIVLNPERGSKELAGLANAIKSGGEGVEEYSVATSIAVVLIWQPFDHSKPTIRILYPGACPLEKLYASLEKLKGEECLRHVEFVSADLEKYSSNLSLNTRGSSRRSMPATKVSPGLRAAGKPSPGLSPRIPVPPKSSPQAPKSMSRISAQTESKLRSSENTQNSRVTGVTKRPVTLAHGRAQANSAVSAKNGVTNGRTSLLGKKEVQVSDKSTSKTTAKPPAVPRKSFVPGAIREKKIQKATKDPKVVEKSAAVSHVTESAAEVLSGLKPVHSAKPSPVQKPASTKASHPLPSVKVAPHSAVEESELPTTETTDLPAVKQAEILSETEARSVEHTEIPSVEHTEVPSAEHTEISSIEHTEVPSTEHTEIPSVEHTEIPSVEHTEIPSVEHTEIPSAEHTEIPSVEHTEIPSAEHTEIPSVEHTEILSAEHTEIPSVEHTEVPSTEHTEIPSAERTGIPSAEHTEIPSAEHTEIPSVEHTEIPSAEKAEGYEEKDLLGFEARAEGMVPSAVEPLVPTTGAEASSILDAAAAVSDVLDTKISEPVLETKQDKVRPLPDPKDFTAGPQIPDDNGMLDGIEEPVKLHLVSADIIGEGKSPEADSMASPMDDQMSPNTPREVNKFIGTSCGDIPPASLGLSNLIMAENSPGNKPLINVPVPEKNVMNEPVPPGDMLLNNIAANGNKNLELEKETTTHVSELMSGMDRKVNEDIDPLENKNDLDKVIQTLVNESKNYDLKQEQMLAEIGSEVDEVVKQNGNSTEAMQAQNLLEDAHANDQFLPPVTPKTTKPQTKRTVGLVTKPKLSQPLYFDVVFVPHHGARPALLDEVAAKAFAISVRSKRYILSGQDAGKPYILDGFIAAKNVWNKPELEIDVLPTHSTDGLFAFNNLKQAEMIEAGMNLRCAVDRCTVRLSSSDGSDCDDCCSAFKFEL